MTRGLALASYKIRIEDVHVRAVPAAIDGVPFRGPGVDLRGANAAAVIAAAAPVVAWLDAREPGVRVRSISIRVAGPRVLVSLDPAGDDRRPRAIRFDPPYADELRALARAAERVIIEACLPVLARRGAAPS